WITIQCVTSGPSPSFDMSRMPAAAGRENSSASAPPAAAAAFRNWRRSMARVMASSSHFLAVGGERGLRRSFDLLAGGGVDRLLHAHVGAAAAKVRDGGVDVGIRRLGILLEERRGRHDHPRLAVAA